MRCVGQPCTWWRRELHIAPGIWGDVSANLRYWIRSVGCIELQLGELDSSQLQSKSVRCIHCTKQWGSGRLHFVTGIWLGVPADMRQWVHCVGVIKLQFGQLDCSDLRCES